MHLPFYKYQGTGNDFILIDDRSGIFKQDTDFIKRLCHRNYGIGADGVLLLREREGYDFEMVFYNPDGSPATFCGNGGRCIVAFASLLDIIGPDCRFLAPDGEHSAEILSQNGQEFIVSLEMRDAILYEQSGNSCFLNTGTYHFVEFVEDNSRIDVVERGRAIRYQEKYEPHGTNVNFVTRDGDHLSVRTYEKGVEGETLSCGTGVTASAVAASLMFGGNHFRVSTPGGQLKVEFNKIQDQFKEIRLIGPAVKVFEGILNF